MMIKYKILVALIFTLTCHQSYSIDTLYIDKVEAELYNVYSFVYTYVDSSNSFEVEHIKGLKNHFNKSESTSNVNFGYTEYNCWAKIVVKNVSVDKAYFLINIANPDMDLIDFYDIKEGEIVFTNSSGELKSKSSRAILHRNFQYEIALEPNATHTYLIKTNSNGDVNFYPITIENEKIFKANDFRDTFFNAIIFGILFFIIAFNYYLYNIVKDKLYLYYLFYILFFTIFLLTYDGYFFYLDLRQFPGNLGRILVPCISTVYFIAFAQRFLESFKKWPRQHKILNGVKVVMLVTGVLPILNYQLFVLLAVYVLFIGFSYSFLVFIYYAFKSYARTYLPSQYFLFAFIVMVVSAVIFGLREMGLLPYNFYITNSVRFGFAFESIFLTIAVLERFRIEQENAKITIESNLSKIELQNKELEIINVELEKLSIVASETDNSVAIYDATGRIEWCNSGFEKRLGLTLEDIIKSNKDNVNDLISDGNILAYFEKCLKGKEAVVFESVVHTNSETKVWLQTTLSPYARLGIIEKVIAIDTDITNLKIYEAKLEKAREQAVAADKLKTAFLGNMSHEVRTPLNGILGFSELLKKKEMDADKREKYINVIQNNGEQLVRIIDDIVDISLIESNQLKINPTPINLISFFNEIVDFFESYKSSLGKSHIELKVEQGLKKGQGTIVSDPFRLRQVLNNLVKNAFTYTTKGYVKLICNIRDEKIVMCVEDTGIGVPPEKKDLIFERFRQGDEALSRKYGGSGLGLSICKGILQRLKGNIWIDADYNEGTRICFDIPLIPVEKEQDEEVVQTIVEEETLDGKRLLIVEDHDVSYEYFLEILAPHELVITRAVDGLDAIKNVKENIFDLVLMDINLPELDGVAATKEIRKFNPDLLIIAQTAYVLEWEKQVILSAGCNDIITKPIKSQKLFDVIRKHLSLSKV